MYRYRMTKNQCLIQAFIATMSLIFLGLSSLAIWFHEDMAGRSVIALGLLVLAGSAGICWYRWLAYDKYDKK